MSYTINKITERAFNHLQARTKLVNDLNGWTPTKEDLESKWFIAGKLALLHSEVSEALEGYRNNDMDNFKEEVADIIIRTLDLLNNLDINDIVKTIFMKLDKNEQRGYKHDGKKI